MTAEILSIAVILAAILGPVTCYWLESRDIANGRICPACCHPDTHPPGMECEHLGCCCQQDFPDKQRLLSLLTGTIGFSAPKARLVAYNYTKAHERKITEKQEEVIQARTQLKIYQSYDSAQSDKRVPIQQHILAILEAQLAELLRGFKEVQP